MTNYVMLDKSKAWIARDDLIVPMQRAFAQSLFASGVDGLMLTMMSSTIAMTIKVVKRVEACSGGAGVRVFGQV